MKRFAWDAAKNAWLNDQRHVAFEEVVQAITTGDVLDAYDHPNKQKYPNQKVFVVRIRDYAYFVPYVEMDEEIFFKTIIPNRRATRLYLRGES